jgi:predicted enzyme related to lactoylglutathione lyase
MTHAVNWFQIQGRDGKALVAFYQKLFGWKMMPLAGDNSGAMVAPEPGGIPGGIGTTMDGSDKSVAVYISVANIDAHLKKIAKAGGRKALEKMTLPDNMGFVAGFIDPAGNWVGLWEPSKTPSAPTAGAAKAVRSKKTAKKAAKKAAPKKAAKKAAPKKAASKKAAKKAPKKKARKA